jgi:hypothetical protein
VTDDRTPSAWSFATPPRGMRRVSRRALVFAVVAVVVLIAGLITWLVWPQDTPQSDADAPVINKTLLNDKPPTTILNALDYRSLYPPGYVDYDYSKSEGSEPLDLDRDYEESSTPPGCDDNPLFESQYSSILDIANPETYRGYPITLRMYPVDDPGGTKDDTRGFSVSISPAKNPANLDEFRQWFDRCENATITTTVTKFGQFIERTTETQELGYTDPPASTADDAFTLTKAGKDQCDFYGLTRGMMVEVECPPTQHDAGAQLFRTVIQRIQDA